MAKRSAIKRAVERLAGHGDKTQESTSRPAAARASRRRSTAARHNRKCNVCRHPDRKAIDQDFLSWRSPDQIAKEYGIADHSSIYRHAHATGLFDRRANTIRLALAPIIEHAMTVEVTADAVIRAVELLAKLNADGQFVKPPTHVIHHSNRSARLQTPKPNRQNAQVEHNATH